MYKHKLKANQIKKHNYLPKDYTLKMSIQELVQVNCAIAGTIPIFKMAYDIKQIKKYNKEKLNLIKSKEYINMIINDTANEAKVIIFDKYFKIDNSKFINIITIK